ncbi:hypothetical protein EI94DRAFT_321269 [Lactarius quietus]|nr:hypothetical protein EI94DRAFT_321269 [Lactarius quietus]
MEGMLGVAVDYWFENHLKGEATQRRRLAVRRVLRRGILRGIRHQVVEGSFTDLDLLTSHARKADITANATFSDDGTLSNAVLAGHKVRVTEDEKPAHPLGHEWGGDFMDDAGREGSAIISIE